MENKTDYCTYFFETWVRWKKPSWKGFVLASLYVWEMFPLSELCRGHDDAKDERGGCDSSKFAKGLFKNRVVGGLVIFIVASIACWIKYPISMLKRI